VQTHKLIHLPENYFGVAARIAAISFQLRLVNDRTYVDDLIDRAAQQFTSGALFADDALPTGRYDRYSNEYARAIYDAAQTVGRPDVMEAVAPSLKEQMRLWWDLLAPDGYGYSWGRSLGAISYVDTMEIAAFVSEHPGFRPRHSRIWLRPITPPGAGCAPISTTILIFCLFLRSAEESTATSPENVSGSKRRPFSARSRPPIRHS
jgi:hypothetical protein